MNMARAFALKRALEDADFCQGLTEFLDAEIERTRTECCAAMKQRPAQIELAIAFAGQESGFSEAFHRLEEFTKEALNQ